MDSKAENRLPKRKELRLKQYDYSSRGAYFVTICVKDRKPILSAIEKPVGVGALDDPQIRLTEIGKTIEKHLLSSEKISGVTIDQYVIMPDHLHIIIFLDPDLYPTQKSGSSGAPTPTNEMLPRIVSAFKRLCARELGSNVFQRGYIEHIVRDQTDYDTRAKYIYENPIRWYYKGSTPTNKHPIQISAFLQQKRSKRVSAIEQYIPTNRKRIEDFTFSILFCEMKTPP